MNKISYFLAILEEERAPWLNTYYSISCKLKYWTQKVKEKEASNIRLSKLKNQEMKFVTQDGWYSTSLKDYKVIKEQSNK